VFLAASAVMNQTLRQMQSGRAMNPTELEWLDRRVVWHGFTQMAEYQPLVIERGEGNWLVDIHGRRILDGVSSLWCNLHGHNHPRLNQAITAQLGRVAHVTSLGMGCDTTATLAGRLVEIAPGNLPHVFFSSDGSSAVEAAIKLAFQYWHQSGAPQRTRFVALRSAYHGDTTGTVSLGGVEHFHRMFSPLLFEVLRGPFPTCYRTAAGSDPKDLCATYLDELETVLDRHAAEVAAIVIEPLVQGAAGLIVHPPGFLAGVRRLADRYGCLLICDEVATGFGRTGKMFASEHEDVVPDLLCVGKGLTGGYLPMAATMAASKIWDAFLGPIPAGRQFFHGHTFSGNPLAAAAAIASLDLFASEQILSHLPPKISRLQQKLAPLDDHPHVGDIRQCGMMIGIELVADRLRKTPFPSDLRRGAGVCQRALQRGVWIRPLGDVLVLMPPLGITDQEIDLLVETVILSIEAEFS